MVNLQTTDGESAPTPPSDSPGMSFGGGMDGAARPVLQTPGLHKMDTSPRSPRRMTGGGPAIAGPT
jgi:hypothetical protein